MYSSLGLIKNSKRSGKIVGTHQKLDRAARRLLGRLLPKRAKFPREKDILYFEGSRGPDGLKRKSPGEDEPWHFVEPGKDNQKFLRGLMNHQFNLRQALAERNEVRAAFEAAWLAHAITDGLTPAHHYPYDKVVEELMSDMDYKRLFGAEIKGIMRGHNLAQAARNNWLYWGAGGVMTKHIAFEYGVAYALATFPIKQVTPVMKRGDLTGVDLGKEFEASLARVNALQMYQRFRDSGWTRQLMRETRDVLVPEIIRMTVLAWASALPQESEPATPKVTK